MNITDRFTKVIEYSQFTPAEFAEEIGVQRSSISHILSGRNKPSLDFITKIKSKFPELQWDWLINGEGDMLINKSNAISTKNLGEPEEEQKTQKKSIPDLFSLISDEQFGQSESAGESTKQSVPKIENSVPEIKKNIIADSQPLQNNVANKENVEKKIKRIVFFYDDGTFENYQN